MNDWMMLILAIALLVLNAYFVIAEYALVSSRPSKIEADVKGKVAFAALVQNAIKNLNSYVALIQICITALGIAVGSYVEPWLSEKLASIFPEATPNVVISVISIVIAAYPLVVLGELVPKYYALRNPEGSARGTIGPLKILEVILRPVTWLFQASGQGIVKLLKLEQSDGGPTLSADEIFFMIRSGKEEGSLDEAQADFVTRTLKLDKLDAEDAMIHRLDIDWLPADLSLDETLQQLKESSHNRIPICEEDVDQIVGIVYIQDIIRSLDSQDFSLRELARPPVFVPENLTLDRLVGIMRQEKSQIVIVQDEYGGTSGLVTLEDVIEEVFGDLEDALEHERAPIEWRTEFRLTARADVRYDELLSFVNLEADDDDPYTTESLASIIMSNLNRSPRMYDSAVTSIGTIRAEQVSRRRIIRVGITLDRKILDAQGSSESNTS